MTSGKKQAVQVKLVVLDRGSGKERERLGGRGLEREREGRRERNNILMIFFRLCTTGSSYTVWISGV